MARALSLLIVNYRSANLAAAAVASARRATSRPIEVVIVDNSVDAVEAERVRAIGADRVLTPARNLGYGAALNLARQYAGGDILLLSNPDVVFSSGCIDSLLGALEAGSTVAGPRLSWDDAGRWLLPPADSVSAMQRIREAVASRISWSAARRDRSAVRRRIQFWEASAPIEVEALSGAVLAMSADTFDRAGRFDAGFFLYFEEHDLVRRIRSRRGSLHMIPDARCRHLYDQSARSSPEAARTYGDSERRFFINAYGPVAGRLIARLPRRIARAGKWIELQWNDAIELPRAAEDVVVEVTPLQDFATAAGHFPEERIVVLPPEIFGSYHQPFLHARILDRKTAEPLVHYRWSNAGRIGA